MDQISQLEWSAVREHYDIRSQIHSDLLALHATGDSRKFAALLLGISDGHGNYSASEHHIGPRILAENVDAEERVHEFASQVLGDASGKDVPRLVRDADLKFMKIAIGSEAAAMVCPERCWVTNTRTIWAHLLIKHADDARRASEELALYKDGLQSEMSYRVWTAIHLDMDTAQTRISEHASRLAAAAGVNPGPLKYLWADAVADALYTGRRP